MSNVVAQRSGSLTLLHSGSYYAIVEKPMAKKTIDDAIPVTATEPTVPTLSAHQPDNRLTP